MYHLIVAISQNVIHLVVTKDWQMLCMKPIRYNNKGTISFDAFIILSFEEVR